MAHRTRLDICAGAAVVLPVFLIALVLANTGRVKVSWVLGASWVWLVWLVIFSSILGLLLGMVLAALFPWRTRTPCGWETGPRPLGRSPPKDGDAGGLEHHRGEVRSDEYLAGPADQCGNGGVGAGLRQAPVPLSDRAH
jgi:hypothetical protein